MERPAFWEYFLTEELLRSKLEIIKSNLDAFKRGLIFKKTKILQGQEFLSYCMEKIEDLIKITQSIMVIFNEKINESWGKPGESGNAIEIKRTVDWLIAACAALLEWEIDLNSITPPNGLVELKKLLHGFTFEVFDELFCFPEKIIAPLNSSDPKGQHVFILTIKPPSNSDEILKKFIWYRDHPNEWIKNI